MEIKKHSEIRSLSAFYFEAPLDIETSNLILKQLREIYKLRGVLKVYFSID